MSTMTTDRGEEESQIPPLARNAELVTLPHCTRCKLSYVPSKSTSALRLTYCSFLCELGDLGFSMSGLEHMERAPQSAPEPTAVPA
jgi:hypothetical protein